MIICPYCIKETSDEEFCDSCGKFLDNDEVETNVEKSVYKYKKSFLNCITFISNLDKENMIEFNCELIQNPVHINNDGFENQLYFIDKEEISLEEYLDNNNLSFNKIFEIILSLSKIFSFIEKEEYVLGSVNLSDFWMKNNDISNIFYRQSRRLLKVNDSMEDYCKGDIYSPEVSNGNIDFINKSTDVYLIGKLFINLAINKKYYIQDYEHERYVGYNLNLFNSEIPRDLHNWIGKSTSIFSEERYQSVEECMSQFLYLCNLNETRLDNDADGTDFDLEYDCITDVGKSKVDASKVTDISKANEDSFLVLKNEGKLFAMVSDGVSNCSFGSGYDASNVVKDVCSQLWEEQYENITDEKSVKSLINNILNESNKRIFELVKDEIEENITSVKGIMAATFSVAIILKNTLYYISIGDSPIYLLNNDNITMLNIEDNFGNSNLKNGICWSEYKNLEEKSSLIKFIGGDFALNSVENNHENDDICNGKLEFEVNKLKLVENDLLMICSDGLTDYMNPRFSRGDIWSKDNKLKSVFLNEDASFESINEKLVNIANENGGGDNITIVLIKTNIK